MWMNVPTPTPELEQLLPLAAKQKTESEQI